jgi:hypothetical protein
LRRSVLIEHIANAWGDLLVLLIVFCKIDNLTLLNIKLINTLSTFRRWLFLDIVEWFDKDESRQMKYSPSILQFCWLGRKLFGGRFIRGDLFW